MRGPHTAMKSGPRSPQLEKALAQKRRPNIAKNKLIFKKNKTKLYIYDHNFMYRGFLLFFLYSKFSIISIFKYIIRNNELKSFYNGSNLIAPNIEMVI